MDQAASGDCGAANADLVLVMTTVSHRSMHSRLYR